jgi:hypothetical protein
MAQTKGRRGITSAQRRRDLALFITDLMQLQAKYPRIHADIQSDIDNHVKAANRTREQDRSDVLSLIDDWRDTGLTIQEIEDDTGLSDRTIRGVLEELLGDPPRVGVREEQAGKHGRRAKNYFSLSKKL